MENKNTNKNINLVRVIRDVRNASLDYFIPEARARELYKEHKLHKDVNNLCYGSSVYGGKVKIFVENAVADKVE